MSKNAKKEKAFLSQFCLRFSVLRFFFLVISFDLLFFFAPSSSLQSTHVGVQRWRRAGPQNILIVLILWVVCAALQHVYHGAKAHFKMPAI